MANKDKRPPYFAFYKESAEQIILLEDSEAGRVIKSASLYFTMGEIPQDLTQKEQIVFNRLKSYIDGSYERYNAAVENGIKGANKRYGKKSTEKL